MDQLSDILKQGLIRKGLSQAEAAQLAEIERKTFNSYVVGRTEPDLTTLKTIIKVLGIEREISTYLLEQNVPFPKNEVVEFKDSPAYLAGKLAVKDEVIAEKEARRIDAMEIAKKMEDHYQDMKTALERAQVTINEILKPIKEHSADILINSKETADHLAELANEVRVEHRVMMDSIDVAAEQPIGTTRAKAGNVELIVKQEHSGKGKQTSAGKQG